MIKLLAVDIGNELIFKDKGIKNVFPDFGSFFSTLLFNIIALVGISFLILLIFGGLNIIMGAGKADSGQTGKGKKAVGAALIGLVVVIFSYVIIQIVEVITGMKIISPPF